MGSILSKCGWKNNSIIRMSLLNDEEEMNFVMTEIEELNNKNKNLAQNQINIANRQKDIIKQLDIIIKHQKKHLERIKTIENTLKKTLDDSFLSINDKITRVENKKSLYKILNNINEDNIEYFCNKHQSENNISWLPDNVEKNIYLNCLTFLKSLVNEENKLLESSIYENENFYSIKDSRTDIIWNNKTN